MSFPEVLCLEVGVTPCAGRAELTVEMVLKHVEEALTTEILLQAQKH